MLVRTSALALAALALAGPARAADDAAGEANPGVARPAAFPGPFDRLGRNLVDSFLGPQIGFQLAAVAATATMTSQDVDVRVHRYFHDHPRWGRDLYPVIVAGVAGPVALFGGLQTAGRLGGNPETVGAAYAVLQAGALTLGYVTALKLVTGRPAPGEDYIPSVAADDEHLSRKFRFGFNRGGVVAGWPSGHVAVTTAMLSALAFYYPDSWVLKAVLVVGSAGMALGVSAFEAGGMHWASDAVAGALMAFPIGMATGRGMRIVVDGQRARPVSAWFVVPSLGGAMVGHSF